MEPPRRSSSSGPEAPSRLTLGSYGRRAVHVARIVARYGFAEVVHSLGLGRLLHGRKREDEETAQGLGPAARLRMALEEIGATGIKIGQMLASRGDLLPTDFVQELRKLQDAVPPFPFEQAREVIEQELGQSLEALFEEFDPEPVAAASLSQVHRARLAGGRLVAVKVQRPTVRQQIEQDLVLLAFAAREAQRYSEWARENDVVGWASEFGQSLRAELDFRREAASAQHMRENLAHNEVAFVPAVHWNLTSARVLTSDFVEGVSPNEAAELDALGLDRASLAREYGKIIFQQVTEAGFFHADPHAGNMRVLPDGRIALLDFGHVDYVGRELRDYMFSFLLALVEGDSRGVVNVILAVGMVGPRTVLPSLRLEADRAVARYSPAGGTPRAVLEAMDALLALVLKHGIRVPPTFISLLRAVTITEGVCLELDPSFDVWRFTSDTVKAETFQRFAPHQIFSAIQSSIREWGHYLKVLPRQLSDMMMRAQTAGTRVRLEWEHADRHLHRLDVMVNRLSFAIVVAAIIMASATILASAEASAAIGSPVAVAFVAVGALMGLWLLYSVLRSGRL